LISKGKKPAVTANLEDFPKAFECKWSYYEHATPTVVKAVPLRLDFDDWEKNLTNP